jgi:hypothetical protein
LELIQFSEVTIARLTHLPDEDSCTIRGKRFNGLNSAAAKVLEEFHQPIVGTAAACAPIVCRIRRRVTCLLSDSCSVDRSVVSAVAFYRGELTWKHILPELK